ncbi:hypothetical protein F511_42913 [Dorcoceras hygrometricum]|uniref:Uncharacterized protein n=1 Tax=Dorcoceras hygrometricum TaxID=472368 RepID=A0A2Z6ZX77_9LAMI|nr:hypothetical protein F511_44877 [Dorcoceras hygrometricum]KZV37544.1 hypothetical protein F511_42913 [Dorcoceras hygrometricum]
MARCVYVDFEEGSIQGTSKQKKSKIVQILRNLVSNNECKDGIRPTDSKLRDFLKIQLKLS